MAEHGTLFLYVVAMAFALLYGGFQKRGLYLLCAVATGIGFLLQTFGLVVQWATLHYLPVITLSEMLQATAWSLALLFFLSGCLYRHRVLIFFLLPLLALAQLTAGVVPVSHKETQAYFYTPWFSVHITLLVLGMALFLYAFLYSTVFIMQDHRLRHRKPPLSLNLPSLEESARWATRCLLSGYLFFTVGIFSSALYGVLHRGQSKWRPGLLEYASVAAWLLLSVAVYGWLTARVNPRRRSWIIVAGAACILLIILGIQWH